ncbi:MAG: hypothetical protein A3J79_06540, partial [Elusimicrobia bacterium RIFOXYB2_FULL_62_6]
KLSAGRAGLLECDTCGVAVGTRRASPAPEYIPGQAGDIYVAAKKSLFALALDFLEREAGGPALLLDIGCAGGELLKAAAARGWKAEGVELHAGLSAQAAAAGFRIYARPAEDAGVEDARFDAVTAFEVFSAMTDPAAAAAAIFAALKPGGTIYLREYNAAFHLAAETPALRRAFGIFGLKPSVLHNFNFRAASLRALLGGAGFRDIKIRNSRPTEGDPYRTGGPLGRGLTGRLKFLYYYLSEAVYFAFFGRVFTGSSLIATAKKP